MNQTMKTRNLLFPVLLVLLAIVIQSSVFIKDNTPNTADDLDIPDNVKSVLDNKCFGCHNVEGKSDKAKDKLLLDKLNELSKVKLIAKLGDIAEAISDDNMPPEKFIEQKPEAKLSEEQKTLLVEWSEQSADKLME
jgi:hypothetical protein